MYLGNLKGYIKYYTLISILVIKLNILLNIRSLITRDNNVEVI